jgi:hypothetical protein
VGQILKHGRLAAAIAAVVIVLIGGWWLVNRPTTLPVERDRAVNIARDFFTSADAHGGGVTVSNVSVTGGDLYAPGGRAAWKIQVQGDVTEAGATGVTYFSVMWIFVDAENGTVTVIAQG